QTPAARIRTRTSPGPGASSSRSSIVNGRDLAYGRTRPLSRSTAPRMFTARRLSQGLRALLLVIGHDGDPPCVAVVSRERFGQERLDDGDRFVLRMLSGTDRDDLSIVVRTCQLRDLRVPGQRGASALDQVRRHLLTVAGPADDDAERLDAGGAVVDHGLGRGDAERRIVIECVVFERTVVDDLMPCLLEVGSEDLFEFESGVVGAEMDLHLSAFRTIPADRAWMLIGKRAEPATQSKFGPWSRVRLSSKNPRVEATASAPSKSRPASSPFGAGVTPGPKKAVPATRQIGVPTSSPTRARPSSWEAWSAAS